MRQRRNWLLGTAGLCFAGVFAALVYAPYLPRLLAEGYPQATWPAPGSYATVAGVADAGLPPRHRPRRARRESARPL
jgi:hypothetical protein